MEVLDVLALFLVRLAAGYAVCLAVFAPQVTRGPWVRVSLFVIPGLALSAAAAGGPLPACLLTAGAAPLVERGRAFGVRALAPVPWLLPGALWALYAAEMAARPAHGPREIYVAVGLAGGLAAGATLAAMLLGHGYLTARDLGFAPLRRLAVAVLVILGVRVLTVLPVFIAADHPPGDWIFLAARAAFGLVVPLVFGWMAYQCVRIESNQSATGIYYPMTVLVGGGELIATWLRVDGGIPA
ncbi:MAG: hypothetical protein ACE5JG_04640 [Planctomycetota bacterium]